MSSHLLSLDLKVLVVSVTVSSSSFPLLKSSVILFAYVELNRSRAVNLSLDTSETVYDTYGFN